MRSAFNDAVAAKKLKPDHLKALIRVKPINLRGFVGAQCCLELRNFSEALQWCEEGLRLQPKDLKLQELRATADKLKRTAERDARKAKVKEKKQRAEMETLLKAIKERGIKLLKPEKPPKHSSDDEDEDGDTTRGMAALDLDGLSSQEATGFKVYLDDQGILHWPVLFLYPEHGQTDFISSFKESDRFIDHLAVMFGEELPPWDTDRKYHPQSLQLYFDDDKGELVQFDQGVSLLSVLKNDRCFVKEGTPSFTVLVKGSPFCMMFLSGKTVHQLK
ncbi:hypothetical protein Z043_123393 [Scleropages formosus]|uniref:Cns1/TTC4 wheel domain-containing protein n=1 Tax=Scleropages formosus TaxID=113540 RepID=A0A0N8JVQ0_SCLFO|nr:hypothetical protein Z043_123393 [Scleropages formosus]